MEDSDKLPMLSRSSDSRAYDFSPLPVPSQTPSGSSIELLHRPAASGPLSQRDRDPLVSTTGPLCLGENRFYSGPLGRGRVPLVPPWRENPIDNAVPVSGPQMPRRNYRNNDVVPASGPLMPRRNYYTNNPVPTSGPLVSRRPSVTGRDLLRMASSGPLRFPMEKADTDNERNVVPVSALLRQDTARFLTNDAISNGGRHDNFGGGRHENLLKSGPLGRCDDPFCTTCPAYFGLGGETQQYPFTSTSSTHQLRPMGFWGMSKFIEKAPSWRQIHMLRVLNPHTKRVQQWNQIFVITCFIAIFVDPLFFLILSVNKDYGCIYFNVTFSIVITAVRSITDLVYFLHMLLQLRLAYVASSSQVVGAGELVDDPRKILSNYFKGWFPLDLFVVLPLPQIMIWVLVQRTIAAANMAKNFLRVTILLQYIPRMVRFVPFLAGNSPTGFIFETAWANFFINLFLFILVAHVVGSCWYLFGLQRVNQCLRNACTNASVRCDMSFLDCGNGDDLSERMRKINGDWSAWIHNSNMTSCFTADTDVFTFGIYSSAVNVTVDNSTVNKYIYSLFWGFQQISSLAGNQIPSLFIWEVLFTMAIVGFGLLLTVLLIGNMQNFLLSLSRRRVEMQLKRYDVEVWMARRRLPPILRRKVREAERLKWAFNKGVNEEELLKNLPEDLQNEIRCHLCLNLVKKVRLLTVMEDHVLDAICERLRPRLYIEGSEILRINYPIDRMHFFIRGTLKSNGADGNPVYLKGGDICGEELIMWCLECASVQPVGLRRSNRSYTSHHATSSRTVQCLDNVEAFSLEAADLVEVASLFNRSLRNPKVQGAIRYESPYWRERAALGIQVAWRYRKKLLARRRLNAQNSFATPKN